MTFAANNLTPDQRTVYQALARAANTGAPCPSNRDICELTGGGSISRGPTILAMLEAMGLITVRRFGTGREVTVTDTGKETARVGGSRVPHWSERGIVRTTRRPDREQVDALDRPDDDNLPPAVHRDACPRCGARGDIDCGHTGARLAVVLSL